jgi:hypothetical protein
MNKFEIGDAVWHTVYEKPGKIVEFVNSHDRVKGFSTFYTIKINDNLSVGADEKDLCLISAMPEKEAKKMFDNRCYGYPTQVASPEESAEYWAKVKETYEKKIAVTNQHKQPSSNVMIGPPRQYAKPGVYISEYYKEPENYDINPNEIALPQGVMVSSLPPEKTINIGTPETFKIGDRVRVKELTDPARPDCYLKLSKEFGVVLYVGDICATVDFPQFSENFVVPFRNLKKEFAVGDKVYYRSKTNGVGTIKSGPNPNYYDNYLIEFPGAAMLETYYGDLEYVPEVKKETEGAGTVTIGHVTGFDKGSSDKTAIYEFSQNHDAFGPSFQMNQPITLDRGTHKSAIKFLNSGDDNIEVLKTTIKDYLTDSLDKRDNTSIMKYLVDRDSEKRNKSMSTVFENIYGVQTTYSATIVLANGETVNIPDPDAKAWELKRTTKFDEVYPCFIDSDDRLRISCFDEVFFAELADEHSRCWAKDMARIVNEEIDKGPFEKHFSYVSEIREYIRKPLQQKEEYPCCFSTLRNLW